MWKPIKRFVLCSQGLPIFDTDSKIEAIEMARKSNDEWLDYVQKCIDLGTSYADNEVSVFDQFEYSDVDPYELR